MRFIKEGEREKDAGDDKSIDEGKLQVMRMLSEQNRGGIEDLMHPIDSMKRGREYSKYCEERKIV